MDNAAECVRVAVNIRPLINSELLAGCSGCVTVAPGELQVEIGSHSFTYDYVYGGDGSPCSTIYDECVAPLVEAVFHGYNATVLAYGQTGSGKTYTMGTNYSGEGSSGGVIPKVMETVFKRVDSTTENTEFLMRVSFIEIFKEEVFDLLDTNSVARTPIQIRETVSGGIILAGVTEAEVRSKEEMGSYLSRGSLARATASTNMNSQSSRSHAIFTITMEQKKYSQYPAELSNIDDIGGDILCAKLHLVDLAGSERAKRTGGDRFRLKEGIHINKGLLALGNVISALGDEKKRKEGGHIPYRDSKLTRLLQDSLGGNCKAVMIACVSPADTNAEETLNTLKYANRARNIQNKAVINRDPMASQMQRMRSQIEQLQTKVSLLEVTCQHLSQRALEAQAEKDKLVMQVESSRRGKSWDEIDSNENLDSELVKSYVSKIQELEGELLLLKDSSNRKHGEFVDFADLNDGFCSKTDSARMSDDVEDQEKELEYSSLQEKLDMELKELDKKLEQKEVLQSKTEEAAIATKRLKELLEARKASSRASGTINGNGPGMKALLQAIEHELEVALCVHEVRSEFNRQQQEKARMANEISKLKEEAAMLKQTNLGQCSSELSPGARNSRIFALENMLASSSSTLVCMASQLSEAEEWMSSSARGRWNQVRTLVDARYIMDYLFSLASSSRCLSLDKEFECNQKQRAELIHQVKSQICEDKDETEVVSLSDSASTSDGCSCSERSGCMDRRCECRRAGPPCPPCGLKCACDPRVCQNREDRAMILQPVWCTCDSRAKCKRKGCDCHVAQSSCGPRCTCGRLCARKSVD